MNVTIINLTSGRLSSGYQKYLRELTPLLAADSRVGRVTVLSPEQSRELILLPGMDHRFWARGSRWAAGSWIKAQVAELQPDVVFVPTARWIDCGRIPVTVMVRNMEPLLMPAAGESVPEVVRNLARREAARRSCRRAARVIAVSGLVREFLVSRWSIPNSKVGVVYHGVTPVGPCADKRPAGLRSSAFDSPFLFTAGSIRPARGLEDVIEAVALLKRQGRSMTLVIAGEVTGNAAYQTRLRQLVAERQLEEDVYWTGTLTPDAMTWCFRNCALFVMTSRVEACPNTALEALAAGATIVSNRNPPMPEFFESSAAYYEAGCAPELSERITEMLTLPTRAKERLRETAVARATDFTWQKAADRTISELEVSWRRTTALGSSPARPVAEPL